MSETKTCPKCGDVLPDNAPAGICPKCLLQAGLENVSEATSDLDISTAALSSGFDPPDVDEVQKQFPQLEILELIGKGGMGAVYKARQLALDRLVAVKILPPEIGVDPAFAERFMREARALARLSHQNIIAVYEFGQADRQYYFIMEYIDGANLRQLIQTSKITPEQGLAIVPQICEALQYAHSQGIVHRDIKPENILIDKQGRVKIADFGLAKLLGKAPSDATLTGAHQVMGTLHYMAPEQMRGSHAVDHRADIYSLGVVFYEMLTGQLPIGRFEPPSKKVQIDVRLDEVVLRALENEPARRYQQASEVKTDVEFISSSRHAASLPQGEHQAEQFEATTASAQQMRRRNILRLALLGVVVTFFLVGTICYARGYKPEMVDISNAVWVPYLAIITLGFLAEALLYPRRSRGLSAAFVLIFGGVAMLICIALYPQPLLDWLCSVTGQSPGKGDRVFLRVIIGMLIPWMVWQAVKVRRKLYTLQRDK